MIAETRIYPLGIFTIREQARPDNPAWPVYIVIFRERVIGRGFSKPSISDCEWMLSQREGEISYAVRSNDCMKQKAEARQRGLDASRRRGRGIRVRPELA